MTVTKLTRTTFALVATCILFAGCKKAAINHAPENSTALNQAEVGKQIALNIYKSLSLQLKGGQPISISGATPGKALAVQTIGDCGKVILRNTDSTAVSGDTTRKFSGNSIFTLVCTGDKNDLYGADAYTLADTLTINETGTNFTNKYVSTQNYLVKSIIGSPAFNTTGSVTINNQAARLQNGNVTQAYKLATVYTIEALGGRRYADGSAKYVLGRILFNCTQTNQVGGQATQTTYAGHIMYYSETSIAAFFNIPGEPFRFTKYSINLSTGEVSAPVESGPF